ncbi:hypothetical protein ACFSX9_02050 [Flavobacterium ardleyense]|uniref:Uncharacterized protein n=1 Tax=Flavobacterium ardleyense TaxID=2038737 RepID=A0ABW5Z4Z9_9FLAO
MENKIDELRRKSELVLCSLKAHPKKEGVCQISVNFANYVCLFGTISDLMKLCSVAIASEEPFVSDTVDNPTIDVASVLELAMQLIPHPEAEFLDEVKAILNKEPEQEIPLYNYSTTTVLEKKTS